MEITFSKTLFWNTLSQYNTIEENFSANSRLNRALSHFQVYLMCYDNYAINNVLAHNFRSINLRLTY